jgi:hypothetical protein
MYVACKLCGGWFNAVPVPDARSVECAHCHAPIMLRTSSYPPGVFEVRYRDRAEFRSLLAVQQAVLEKRVKRADRPPSDSDDVDNFGRPYRHPR